MATRQTGVVTCLALALALLATGLVGCGGGHATGPAADAEGSLRLTVRWPEADGRVVPNAAQVIAFELVSDAEPGNPRTATIVRPATSTTFGYLPVGQATLTATALPNADGSGVAQASASVRVTIQAGANALQTLTLNSAIAKWQITPNNPSVALGAELTLAAAAYNSADELILTPAPTWRITSGDDVLEPVDAAVTTGSNWAVRAIAEGTAEVEAQVAEGDGASQVTRVTVTVTGLTGTLTIEPADATVVLGAQAQYRAFLDGVLVPADQVVWSVQEGATGGSFAAHGMYEAPTEVDQVGTYHLIAAYGGLTAQTSVTLEPATGGRVFGVVTNGSNNQPLEGATVTLATSTAVTNAAGEYELPAVPSGGPYSMTATLPGFGPAVLDQIPRGEVLNVNFELWPSSGGGGGDDGSGGAGSGQPAGPQIEVAVWRIDNVTKRLFVEGQVTGEGDVVVTATLNGRALSLVTDPSGYFKFDTVPRYGDNTVVITAVDETGIRRSKTENFNLAGDYDILGRWFAMGIVGPGLGSTFDIIFEANGEYTQIMVNGLYQLRGTWEWTGDWITFSDLADSERYWIRWLTPDEFELVHSDQTVYRLGR